jgi:hypothetical protein
LHIHKFIFPAFRFLFTRPIPLSTFKFCKEHFSFWVVDFKRKLWKRIKKLCYRTQVKWILLVKAVIVQFFQLLGPKQASQFLWKNFMFMEKLHEISKPPYRRGQVLLPSKITFSCIITHIMPK